MTWLALKNLCIACTLLEAGQTLQSLHHLEVSFWSKLKMLSRSIDHLMNRVGELVLVVEILPSIVIFLDQEILAQTPRGQANSHHDGGKSF